MRGGCGGGPRAVRVDRLLWLDRLSVTIQIWPVGLASSTCCRDRWWKSLLREDAVMVRAWPSAGRRPP